MQRGELESPISDLMAGTETSEAIIPPYTTVPTSTTATAAIRSDTATPVTPIIALLENESNDLEKVSLDEEGSLFGICNAEGKEKSDFEQLSALKDANEVNIYVSFIDEDMIIC